MACNNFSYSENIRTMASNVKRGDIYWIYNPQSASAGEIGKTRPAIVISKRENNKMLNTIEVVFLTTNERYESEYHHIITSHTAGESVGSTVLCEQITTVAKERVGNYIGYIEQDEMAEIEELFLNALGVELAEDDECEVEEATFKEEKEEHFDYEFERDFYKERYEELLGIVMDKLTRKEI